jgi:hypothetical protein
MTDTCEKHCEAKAFKIVIRGLEGEVARLKERLAQEKALQILHEENERLGLYRDAYGQPEQEPVAWMWDVNNGGGYTSKGIGFMQTNIPFAKHTSLFTTPPQRTEQEPVIGKWSLREVYFDEDGEPISHRSPPQRTEQPAQRTWVGLTEQDLDYLCNLAYTGDEEFALAVQAKLMEKNA